MNGDSKREHFEKMYGSESDPRHVLREANSYWTHMEVARMTGQRSVLLDEFGHGSANLPAVASLLDLFEKRYAREEMAAALYKAKGRRVRRTAGRHHN